MSIMSLFNRIIVLILPLHTTHKLQPLDVGLFRPLLTFYTIELDRLISSTIGFTSITKYFFFRTYKVAFDQVFTKESIWYTFAKPGIWPTNQGPMIARVTYSLLPQPE